MSALTQAIALAANVHADQTDKGGEPYILHPIRVMQDAMVHEDGLEIVGAVAVLHDALEDNQRFAIDELRGEIQSLIGDQGLEMCELLTRRPEDSYIKDYIGRIKRSETWAITIKLADLRDNMTILRQPTLRERDLSRIMKYHNAYRILEPRYGAVHDH